MMSLVDIADEIIFKLRTDAHALLCGGTPPKVEQFSVPGFPTMQVL